MNALRGFTLHVPTTAMVVMLSNVPVPRLYDVILEAEDAIAESEDGWKEWEFIVYRDGHATYHITIDKMWEELFVIKSEHIADYLGSSSGESERTPSSAPP